MKSAPQMAEWVRDNRWLVLVFIIVAAASSLLFVSNVRNINALLIENRELEKEVSVLRDMNKRLQSETIYLQSADRIIKFATEELDMVPPDVAPEVID